MPATVPSRSHSYNVLGQKHSYSLHHRTRVAAGKAYVKRRSSPNPYLWCFRSRADANEE